MSDFDEWCTQVDALCRIHFKCSWTDLCGDMEPLQRGYEWLTPLGFVEFWADKYDLDWYGEEEGGHECR